MLHTENIIIPQLNTSLTVIGGIRDFHPLFGIISQASSDESMLIQAICQNNDLSIRTEKSRKRVALEVKRSLVHFNDDDHKALVKEIMAVRIPLQDRQLFFVWQYSLNNDIFREITINVFVKSYLSGRAGISKHDIIAFIKDLIQRNPSSKIKWAESTIETIATKYLNLMGKLGFLSTSRKKSFVPIRPSSEAQVIFLCFAHLFCAENKNILKNKFLPLSFIPAEDLQARLKKLSVKGYFNMNFNGVSLNIELSKSYQGICNALYQ